MKKTILWSSAVVAVLVALAAYTLTFTSLGDSLKPSLTGDRASDATCAAGVAPFIVDGQPEVGKLIAMTVEQRQDMATAIERASRQAAIPEIKQAATQVLGGLAISGGSGIFGQLGFLKAFGSLATACNAHGWNARTAGLVR